MERKKWSDFDPQRQWIQRFPALPTDPDSTRRRPYAAPDESSGDGMP